jgi:hypothetical protein
MLFWRLKTWIAALALAACVIAPAAAQIPDPYARQLAQALARIDEAQSASAHSRAAGPFAGELGDRQGRRFVVMLRAGQSYRVAGVCDDRCGDLDLRLFDSNGALVTQDIAPDRTPVLDIDPIVTGGYAIEASVAHCNAPTCYFAFNVYAR